MCPLYLSTPGRFQHQDRCFPARRDQAGWNIGALPYSLRMGQQTLTYLSGPPSILSTAGTIQVYFVLYRIDETHIYKDRKL